MREGAGGLLASRAILIVEDSFLVAESLRVAVEWAGATVIGPVARETKALALINEKHLDAALLTTGPQFGTSIAIAETLTARHVPYLIISELQPEDLPVEMRRAPYLSKPVEAGELVEAIACLFRIARADGTLSPIA